MKHLLASLLLVSCGASQSADVSWGALRNFNPQNTLLAADTLLICGDGRLRPVANNALWEWNYARGVYHDVYAEWSCQYRYYYDASLYVKFAACSPNVVGYRSQWNNHHDITICNAATQSNWQKVMTHEIGHGFGLCDQYAAGNAGQIVFHANCGWPRSTTSARSVMGGLYDGSPAQLTPDDIAGIRALSR